jgi:HlyD family secretion protein
MKKRIVKSIIIVLAISAGVLGYRYHQNGEQTDEAGVLKIYGSIDIRDAALAFNEQERIAEVLVEEGARVEADQVLARLDDKRLTATIAEVESRIQAQQQVVKRLKTGSRPQEIDQARAEVEAAQVRVKNAGKVLARLEQTSATGATSVQDLDDAKARMQVEQSQLKVKEKGLLLVLEGPRKEDIAVAEHQLEALKNNLSLLQVRLEDMKLIAPARGIIQSRVLEAGEMASPTRPVFILTLTDPKWVRGYVPEPMLGRINLGMRARILSDSFPGRPMQGWVGFISPVAEFTPRVVQTEELRTRLVYETRIFVEDPRDRLRQGMPVTVIVNEEQNIRASESTAPVKSDGVAGIDQDDGA